MMDYDFIVEKREREPAYQITPHLTAPYANLRVILVRIENDWGAKRDQIR